MILTKKEAEKIFHSPIFRGVDLTNAVELLERNGCRVVDFEDGDTILSQS